jgi:hypothetical protein
MKISIRQLDTAFSTKQKVSQMEFPEPIYVISRYVNLLLQESYRVVVSNNIYLNLLIKIMTDRQLT